VNSNTVEYPKSDSEHGGDLVQQTFLFTDLVGFTALTSTEGDDRGAEVACELHDRVRALLGPHEAEEVKTLGDGLMLRCERPEAAVRLGLRIVEGLAEVPGFPPVRVGMATGPAVPRNGDWYGTTVNVAARLCAVAGGGEVLVSEATCEAAGELPHVVLDERRLHWLRNLSQPVAARLASERPCRACWPGLRALPALRRRCARERRRQPVAVS
jgi:adenylate cyclase